MVKRTMGPAEWGLVGLLALLWGGTFYFIEIMLDYMDPASAVLLRVVPAAAGATNPMLVTYLMPPLALTLGVALLDERPTATSLAGMAVIFAGLVLVDGRLLRLSRPDRL